MSIKVTSALVADLVATRPGLSHSAAATALGGGRGAALQSVKAAVTDGLVHEARTLVPTRGGAVRTARGLYPGPASTLALEFTLSSATLQTLRERAGVSLQQLAEQLGVSKTLVYRWERGAQPIPAWAGQELYAAVERAQSPQPPQRRRDSKRLRELLAQVRRSPGISWYALVSTSQRDRRLVEKAHADGLVYEAPAWTTKTRQAGTGLFTGSRPRHEVLPVLMADLKQARRAAGWTHAAMAQHLSDAPTTNNAQVAVAATTYAGWERTLEQIPGWAATQASHALAQARSKRLDAAAADAQQRAAIVATVTSQPGLSRKKLLPLVQASRPYQIESMLTQLLAENLLHERHAGKRGQQTGLYPGAATREVLTPEQLTALRTRAGLLQQELADQIGIKKHALSEWESSRRPMSAEWQDTLRTYLQACPDVQAAERDHLEQQLLDALRERPRTRWQLHLLALGSLGATNTALAALVARGALVQDLVEVPDSAGVVFRRKGFRVPA